MTLQEEIIDHVDGAETNHHNQDNREDVEDCAVDVDCVDDNQTL